MDIVGLSVSLGISGIVCLGSGWWCITNLKKARYLLDTPTSKVRSAAQGYVELYGVLSEGAGQLRAPLTGENCVWWSYCIDEQVRTSKDNQRWQQVERVSSSAFLCLNDSTGDCLIDPAGAQVIPLTKQTWYGDERHPRQSAARKKMLQAMFNGVKRYRYTEQRLHIHEPLYAIGDFVTRGGGQEAFDLDAAQAAVIREWKSDFSGLLRRFDHDRNGQLDPPEWDKVRAAAYAQAKRLERQRHAEPAQHFLRKPGEQQPFILSSYGEDDIAKRFYWQAFFAGIICVGSALGIAYIINAQF